MSDPLLEHYQRELAYVRRLGAEFAQAYPKVAGNLRIGPDSVEDPHVSRLVEAFAFLNARVRQKLDDDFPELSEAMLSVLYPHYLSPIPSLAVVQFEAKPDLAVAQVIQRGEMIETEPIEGEPCRFRTCYPTTVWPIRIEDVKLAGRPLGGPAATRVPGAQSSLRIALGCGPDTVDFPTLAPDTLRFFLRGQAAHSYALYELVHRGCLQVCVAAAPDDRNPILLDRACIRPVGFGPDEGVLPYPARSFLGYRLLTEFFAFPEKFLYFEVTGIGEAIRARGTTRLDLYLYLDRSIADLERNVGKESLALGCTPVVNLFSQDADPVRLNHVETEVRVVPDARRPYAMEVYSVDGVTLLTEEGEERPFQPFYSVRHSTAAEPRDAYWLASRRRPPVSGDAKDAGTEVFLSMVDLKFDPAMPARGTLTAKTTCLNRDLPGRLPFGGGQPVLRLAEGGSALKGVHCLTAPTRTLRPPLRNAALWRLLSHLTLGHLSLSDGADGAEALREILRLYDFAGTPESRRIIEGLLTVTSREAIGRTVSEGIVGVCRGTEVTLEIDEARFVGSGLYLFASVLERFLALYGTVNSFTRLTVRIPTREGETWRWNPRAGDRPLQ
jgi:type VI secretion system protein ImpG